MSIYEKQLDKLIDALKIRERELIDKASNQLESGTDSGRQWASDLGADLRNIGAGIDRLEQLRSGQSGIPDDEAMPIVL